MTKLDAASDRQAGIADPITAGEDLQRNIIRAIAVAPDLCAGCADYHIVNTLKRRSNLMFWEGGARAALLDALNPIFGQLEGYARSIEIVAAACADTAVLATCAHAAWRAGERVLGRTRFVVVDRCPTPLVLCKDFGAAHGLDVRTDVVDLTEQCKGFSADIVILHNFLPFIADEHHVPVLEKLGRWLQPRGHLVIWNPVKSRVVEAGDGRSRVATYIASIKAKIDDGEIEINEPRERMFARLDRMVDDPRPGQARFADVDVLPDLVRQAGLKVTSVNETQMGKSRVSLYATVIAERPG